VRENARLVASRRGLGCPSAVPKMETGETVAITRTRSNPAGASNARNSASVRSCALPNIAIICMSMRYSVEAILKRGAHFSLSLFPEVKGQWLW
jgi:hypothetical protein